MITGKIREERNLAVPYWLLLVLVLAAVRTACQCAGRHGTVEHYRLSQAGLSEHGIADVERLQCGCR